MTYSQINKLTSILFAITTIISIVGLVFKIIDYPNSNFLLVGGLLSAALLGYNEVKRLKKIISVLTQTLR